MTELFAILDATDADARRLHDRLARAAASEGLLDVAYRTVDSPYGPILLARTDAGLVRLAYAVQDHDAVLSELAARISPRVLRTSAGLDDAARELEEYFTGRRRTFEVPLDLRLARGFRAAVLAELRRVPYGSTTSYTALATAAHRPKAIRPTATACASNPLPVVVPCHRVIHKDGNPRGYAGGSGVKLALLTLEGAV
ncbi:MAG: methylated-DNA--[protein]-cysteine S-methyltransferase [Mycobacteriales bacterium]